MTHPVRHWRLFGETHSTGTRHVTSFSDVSPRRESLQPAAPMDRTSVFLTKRNSNRVTSLHREAGDTRDASRVASPQLWMVRAVLSLRDIIAQRAQNIPQEGSGAAEFCRTRKTRAKNRCAREIFLCSTSCTNFQSSSESAEGTFSCFLVLNVSVRREQDSRHANFTPTRLAFVRLFHFRTGFPLRLTNKIP